MVVVGIEITLSLLIYKTKELITAVTQLRLLIIRVKGYTEVYK